MKKSISHALCVIAAAALVSIGAIAQQARKAGKVSPQQSVLTEQAVATEKGAVRFAPVKTKMNTMGLRQAQSTTTRLTMPTTTSAMEAVRQATGVVNFAGCVIYSADESRKGKKAVYDLTSEGGVGSLLSTQSTSMMAGYGACVVDNKYYCEGVMSFLGMSICYLSCYDMENGFAELSSKQVNSTSMSQVLLYDGANVYGTFLTATEGQYTFGTINLTTGAVTTIATVNYNLLAGGVDADGNLWGIVDGGEASAWLAKINKTTGATTKVGDGLGVVPKYLSGAVIDPKSGRMFYNVCPADETGNLYEVNLTTGAATKIIEYPGGEEIVGMYIPFTPEDGAPGDPQNLALSFPNGSLTGKVTFKTPATTAGGATGTGNITYKVMENGTQIATAEVAYGKDVEVPVTVTEAGTYTYIVELSNAVGRSRQAKASMYIGNDVPKSPAPVTATWENGTMTVTWTAVTEGVNGGYLDASKLTYKVTCGDRVVKENATGTSLTEPITGNGAYKYAVVAVCNGMSSEAAESDRVVVGARQVPTEFRFLSQDDFDEFTVIDVNNDKATWTFAASNKAARCKYNSKNDMDDWLISPEVELKAGKVYKVSGIIYNNSTTYTERYEVRIGQGTTAAAMTTTLIAPTDVCTKDTIPVESVFKATADGRYNLGVHGMSIPDQYYLYVVMLKIEEMNPGTPASVTDLMVTADASGALSAKIEFKAPAKAVDGSDLSELTKIQVLCGERVVKEFPNPAPGAALDCTDNTITEAGEYEYTVVATNGNGSSIPVKGSAYVGFDLPESPANVTMTEVSNGRVKITWTAPTTDVNGKPLQASDVTYEIRDASSSSYPLIKELGSVLEYEFDAVEAGTCDFVQFAVFPVNTAGRGLGAVTPFMAIGTPYPTPYTEGFDPMAHPLGMQRVNGNGSWTLMETDETIPATPDGDAKFLAFKGSAVNDASIAFTAKVDLVNVNNPCFQFYVYNITSDPTDPAKNNVNEVSVVVREANGDQWTTVKSAATVHDLCGGQYNTWGLVSADLSAFKGKVVQVGVQATCKLYTYTMFDKWSIMAAYDDNLSADGITAPSSVYAGKELPVNVKVSNFGKNVANNFSVELYDINMETPLATATVDQLASMKDTVVAFNPVFAPGQAGEHTLYAKVVYAADKYMDDNTTDGVIVKVNVSAEPAPTNLEASLDDADKEHVNLTWNAPAPASTQRMAAAVTDDVESYDPWNYTGVGGWKFVDKDGAKSGGMQNMTIPGLTPGTTVTSFFTFSRSGVNGNESFAAHSGDKYFAAMFLYDGSQANDWLISPELNGSAQTISFWARSYSAQYPEKIEVYTSTGSENPDDFTAVEGSLVASVPGTWTKYEVTLPAGAKRFAVRSFAADAFMLMLDDFTYIPADAEPAVLVGYNVYRGNVKINSEVIPAGTTSFKDVNTTPETTYNYYVTAVYDTGDESAPSNVTSVTTYVPGPGMEDVTISVADNTIVVENATETVTVTDMGGVVLFRGRDARVAVTVGKGAYIVSTGKLTQKVMVK